MANKEEVVAWITMNGAHIPIMKGESKASAVSRFINKKREKAVKGIQKSIGLKSEAAARRMYRGFKEEGGIDTTIKGRVNTEEEARKMPYGHRKSRYTYLQRKTYKLNEEETTNIHELNTKIKKANMDELVKIGSDEKGYKHMNPGQRAVASMAGYRRENNGNLVLTSHNGLWKEKDYDSFRRSLDKQGVKKFVSDDSSTGFQDFAKSMLNNGWQIDGVTTYKTTHDWGAPREYTGFVFKKKQK